MKSADVSQMARQEVAAEKARVYGKRGSGITALEREAERLPRELREHAAEGEKTSAEADLLHMQRLAPLTLPGTRGPEESPEWSQYNPWMRDGEKQSSKRWVNAATIWCFAKKMIAREWARARGIKRRDPRVAALQEQAAQWREKEEEEKRKRDEEEASLQRLKEKIEHALQIFANELLRQSGEGVATARLMQLLEGTLTEEAGEVVEIRWNEEGCEVWIEPWEERSRRRRTGETLPRIYHMGVDSELEIVSINPVTDPEERARAREEMMAKTVAASLRDKLPSRQTDSKGAVQEALEEIGRVLALHQTDGEWLAEIEPWEEMRARNIQRGGAPPIVTSRVRARVAQTGQLEIVSQIRQ